MEGIPGEDISSDDNEVKQDCSNITFEYRCVCNVAIFGDRESVLSNYTFGLLVPSKSS